MTFVGTEWRCFHRKCYVEWYSREELFSLYLTALICSFPLSGLLCKMFLESGWKRAVDRKKNITAGFLHCFPSTVKKKVLFLSFSKTETVVMWHLSIHGWEQNSLHYNNMCIHEFKTRKPYSSSLKRKFGNKKWTFSWNSSFLNVYEVCFHFSKSSHMNLLLNTVKHKLGGILKFYIYFTMRFC